MALLKGAVPAKTEARLTRKTARQDVIVLAGTRKGWTKYGENNAVLDRTMQVLILHSAGDWKFSSATVDCITKPQLIYTYICFVMVL